MTIEARTVSGEDTKLLAGAMAPLCQPGDIVLLAGDLGAGKTTFSQGFGRALGIVDSMTSPTFTLVRNYPVPASPGQSIQVLLHADVYRLDHLSEISDLGIGELVEDAAVALVEWGDAAAPVLGKGALMVRLESFIDDDERRTVSISADGGWWDARWDDLVHSLEPWTTS